MTICFCKNNTCNTKSILIKDGLLLCNSCKGTIKETVITFDFDSTLTKRIWDDENEIFDESLIPNPLMISKLKELGEFHRIFIVSSRLASNDLEIHKFKIEHDLPVEEIICTNGKSKGPILNELRSSLHFDDCSKDEEDPFCDFFGEWILVPVEIDAF